MIAALFVEDGGVYSQLSGVDPWPLARDARTYRGPHRVVAHPPCKRWGNYWHGSPSSGRRMLKGDDKGCFAAALWAARTFGGVIEHPYGSRAWDWFGMKRPEAAGWTAEDKYRGRSCCVWQGNYGHLAPKATWLYAVGCGESEMIWGKPTRADLRSVENLSTKQRLATPPAFARALIQLASARIDTNSPVA